MFLTTRYQPDVFLHSPRGLHPSHRMSRCHPQQRQSLAHQGRQVNISDHGDKVELSIDVPGIKASNLKVAVEDGVLTISGTRDDTSFSRQFQLDRTVDVAKLAANLADGVLTITAPKIEEPAPIQITITEEPSVETSEETLETEAEITVETVAAEDDDAQEDEEEVVMVDTPENDRANVKA